MSLSICVSYACDIVRLVLLGGGLYEFRLSTPQHGCGKLIQKSAQTKFCISMLYSDVRTSLPFSITKVGCFAKTDFSTPRRQSSKGHPGIFPMTANLTYRLGKGADIPSRIRDSSQTSRWSRTDRFRASAS